MQLILCRDTGNHREVKTADRIDGHIRSSQQSNTTSCVCLFCLLCVSLVCLACVCPLCVSCVSVSVCVFCLSCASVLCVSPVCLSCVYLASNSPKRELSGGTRRPLQTETDRETDRDRQTERQTGGGKQIQSKTDRQTERQTDRKADKQTDKARHKGLQTEEIPATQQRLFGRRLDIVYRAELGVSVSEQCLESERAFVGFILWIPLDTESREMGSLEGRRQRRSRP